MAVAVPILLYASAAVTAVSAIRQGQAEQAASTFNAITALQNGAMARSEALLQAQQTQRETVLRLGKARAAAGASGGTGEGSAIDVIGDLAREGELERQFEIYKGEASARGYTNTATLDVMRGRAAADAGISRGVSSGLSGATGASRAGESLKLTPPKLTRKG